MNWWQHVGEVVFVVLLLIGALWGAAVSGRWLWRWSARVALRIEEREARLAEM